jgi:WhiB family redox-sensing transcriptional regulator
VARAVNFWVHAARGESWRGRAACRRVDPDLFFPVGPSGPALDQVTQAKRLCLACPVRRPCLDWALRNGIQFGIWGGLTEGERVVLRRTFATLAEQPGYGDQAEQARLAKDLDQQDPRVGGGNADREDEGER